MQEIRDPFARYFCQKKSESSLQQPVLVSFESHSFQQATVEVIEVKRKDVFKYGCTHREID